MLNEQPRWDGDPWDGLTSMRGHLTQHVTQWGKASDHLTVEVDQDVLEDWIAWVAEIVTLAEAARGLICDLVESDVNPVQARRYADGKLVFSGKLRLTLGVTPEQMRAMLAIYDEEQARKEVAADGGR